MEANELIVGTLVEVLEGSECHPSLWGRVGEIVKLPVVGVAVVAFPFPVTPLHNDGQGDFIPPNKYQFYDHELTPEVFLTICKEVMDEA